MAEEFTWQNYPPEQLLVERFKISTGFHPGQHDIIEQLVEGRRILAIQRTGWGKSLCYQLASLYYPHLTIVFSPLKALMRDQCQHCNDRYKIPSAIVSSDFSEDENRATLAQAVGGGVKILFIAPERLDNLDWQATVVHMRISMVVIDEAHCISTWGHDFRPHYRRILRLLEAFPKNIPVLALTATANKRVEQDILQQTGVAQVIRGLMRRPNLFLQVLQLEGDEEKLSYLAELLPKWTGTGIIYTATRANAEMVATCLARQGINAVHYHAGLEDEVRQDIEQKLMSNYYKIVCSTNALGMGIDKPDIRFVIHYNIPASPISYYQEIGRAGRDGSSARCMLFYDPADLSIQEHFIRTAKPEGKHYDSVLTYVRTSHQSVREKDIALATAVPSQSAIRTILADLEEQHLIERDGKSRLYSAINLLGRVDFSRYDNVRQQKLQELSDIRNYALTASCYMDYLTAYLGDQPGSMCGVCEHCSRENFPPFIPTERTRSIVAQFLDQDFLPRIEKRGGEKFPAHEAGWALSYHGTTRIGEMVRLSKYESAGPFPEQLIERAVKVIRVRYPLGSIDGIVSVPPSRSGNLVETFACKVANVLHISYIPALTKIRSTGEQKNFVNKLQKENNVKDAFAVSSAQAVSGRTLLLIDDIYDSGHTLREVGRTLMKAGAQAVYPFTITRTLHSDDQ